MQNDNQPAVDLPAKLTVFTTAYIARELRVGEPYVRECMNILGQRPELAVDGQPFYGLESYRLFAESHFQVRNENLENEEQARADQEMIERDLAAAPAAIEAYNAAANKLEAAIIKVKAEFLDMATGLGIPTETALQLYQREAGKYPHTFERKEFPKYAEYGASYIKDKTDSLAVQERFVLEDAHAVKSPLFVIQGAIDCGRTVEDAIAAEASFRKQEKNPGSMVWSQEKGYYIDRE